jgi:asparagine synthase (glutamine-hydrolysing)
MKSSYQFKTQSDCEVILALYENEGPSFVEKLNGIFAFAIFDEAKNEFFIARDHMGIIPLYMGWDGDGTFYVASELKALRRSLL